MAELFLLSLLITLILLPFISSYSIDIAPGGKECFIVKAAVGIPITGSFEVIHPDANYISVTVTGPKGFLHYAKKNSQHENNDKEEENIDKHGGEESSEGFFSFDAEFDGDHTMCIFNGSEQENDGFSRLIAFNLRATNTENGEEDYQFVGLQSELVDLKEGLDLLKDHQSYMNQREDVHKGTLESINVKVLCWTVLEAVILIAMAIWQISYIRSFFETKQRL
eukprot:gene5275-5810_t